MEDGCIDCVAIKQVEFQIKEVNLILNTISKEQINKDMEHELMIQNLTTRMDAVSQDFIEFKTEVKQDIQSIKDEIPAMFDNAVNRLLAKIAKWLLAGIGGFILFICLLIFLAFSRPYIIQGLQELTKKAQTMEVSK